MILKSITLKNFRTYKAQSLSFHKKFNLIYGNNAQGKTNLLESIYFLCSFRPFKQVKTEDLITFGENNAGIKGEIQSENDFNEIYISLVKGKKTVRLNGKIVYRLSKYVGRFNVVLFLPSDLRIIKGAPSIRRNYIDALISNLQIEHIKDLKDYSKTLSHRNAILSKSQNISESGLEVWDENLAEIGSRLVKRRINIIRTLKRELNNVYNSTSGVDSEINIKYRANYDMTGNISESIKSFLKTNFSKDKLRGYTSVGPHRDVITFSIDDNDASSFASQGESKNLVLAIKASEISLFEKYKGKKPILLLDDITSELDKNRKSFLFNLLEEYAGQVFVTSTAVDEIPYKGDKKVFEVTKGRAEIKN